MSARTDDNKRPGDIFQQGVARMTVLADEASGTTRTVEVIEAIPVELIDPSPLNRTQFDAAKQAEMVESLKQHGQTTAAIVRPKPDGRYELVAGERRWRGCKGAGLATLAAVVRSYTDSQAAEILLLENLEREDLKPTEEAKIYQRLLELTDESGEKLFTLQRIAERVHNDPKKIHRVMRVLTILDLPAALKKAVDEEKISLRTAFMVARIADAEDRKEAGEKVLKGQYGEGPMTLEKAQEFIARTYQVNIRGAKFDRNDPDLLSPETKADLGHTGAPGEANDGSCERCQWLAKNHPVYQHELSTQGQGKSGKARGTGIDPMTCTRARCHEAKLEAMWQQVGQSFAAAHGAERVLSREESEDLHQWNSPYVRLDETPTHQHTLDWQTAKQSPTWGKLLKGSGVPLLVAMNDLHGQEPVLVAERDLAMQVARKVRPDLFAKAKVEGQTNAAAVLSEEEQAEARALEFEAKVKEAVEKRVRREALLKLHGSICEAGAALETLRGLFDSITRNVECMDQFAELMLPGAPEEWSEAAWKSYAETLTPAQLLACCAMASVMDDVIWSGAEMAEDFRTMAAAQGLDVATLRRSIEKEVRAKLKAEEKAKEEESKKAAHTKSRNDMEEIQKRTILEEGDETLLTQEVEEPEAPKGKPKKKAK